MFLICEEAARETFARQVPAAVLVEAKDESRRRKGLRPANMSRFESVTTSSLCYMALARLN